MSADELENLEAPEVPDTLAKLKLKYSLPKRRYLSRKARADDATTILEASVRALDEIADDNGHYPAAKELGSELQNAIDATSGCSFPGMYG